MYQVFTEKTTVLKAEILQLLRRWEATLAAAARDQVRCVFAGPRTNENFIEKYSLVRNVFPGAKSVVHVFYRGSKMYFDIYVAKTAVAV